ncbi:MAG TPA: DUF2934 domain-containing protein [Methylophilaceae bacterium]|nr:DUF2934 domain-containing protein [Methylophilaceae bacterium]
MAATKSAGTDATLKTPAARKPRATASRATGEKKTTSRKSAASAAGGAGKIRMGAEERYRMVEVAAYYLAERNNFAGNPVEYWTQAEAQISSLLGE